MAATIVMDRSGRLVVPKAVRELLRIEGGAKLRADVIGDRLELTPVGPGSTHLKKKRGFLTVPATGKRTNIVEAILQSRRDREEQIKSR